MPKVPIRKLSYGEAPPRQLYYGNNKLRIQKSIRIDENNCWIWLRRLDKHGYGRLNYKYRGKQISGTAYRFAYIVYRGDIPNGLHLDHLCRVRACVNPKHLEAVQQGVNTMRGDTIPAHNARKTHCKHGHEFTVENTYVDRHNKSRHCKSCTIRHNNIKRGVHANSSI